jgi:hypothetical protein
VEVYTPIPGEAVRHSPRPARLAGTLLLVVALLFVSVRLVRYVFTTPSDFHYYGTVETRFGTAGVFCGGDAAPRCGEGTALEVPKCDYQTRTRVSFYSGGRKIVAVVTHSAVNAEELVGKRPPSGDEWVLGCGNAAMIRGGPANLQPL